MFLRILKYVSALFCPLLWLMICCDAAALSFFGPEVLKLDWGTRALNVGDLDGDGLNDLIVVNNDAAQIELLYKLAQDEAETVDKTRLDQDRWDPVLEDAQFKNSEITVGFPIFDLSVGDLDGDGRMDLAYTGREVPLTVRYQNESGGWSDSEEFDGFEALGWTGTLKVAQLDADERVELVVMASDGLRIFHPDIDGHLDEAELYYITGKNPYNLIIEDVTNDGRKDVLYITSDDKQSLVLREQLAEGGLGPELRFFFDKPIRTVHTLPSSDETAVSLCAVYSRSGGIEFFRFQKQESSEHAEEVSVEMPEIYPIFKTGRSPACYEFGDLNDDGLNDLLVASPEGAEWMLFLRNEDHFLMPHTFPSFADVSSMAHGFFFQDGQSDVVIVSAEERMMGISRMKGPRLSFPRQLNIAEGDPLLCSTVNLDGDEYDELAFISEVDNTFSLILAKPKDRTRLDSDWKEIARVDLKAAKRKPVAIREVAIFAENRRGLMIFVPREAPILLSVDDSDGIQLQEVAQASTVRESLLKGVQSRQVSVADIDGDGRNELIVGRTGYARALQLEGDHLEMVDQFNARRRDDEISAVLPLDEGGTLSHLGFYIKETGELQLIERDSDGVFRYHSAVDMGQINLVDWYKLSEPSEACKEFIFAGVDRFWSLKMQASSWRRVVEDSYKTNLEDVFYSFVEGTDFDEDGSFDLIAIDGQNHVVEILSQQDRVWEGRMFWKIFEQNLHYQGRSGSSTEPRQVVVSDLTGDGKLDFAFLIHDRILLYPQQ